MKEGPSKRSNSHESASRFHLLNPSQLHPRWKPRTSTFRVHKAFCWLTDSRSILQGGYQHPLSRSWQQNKTLTKLMLMYPIFITDDPEASVVIQALPGQRRWGVNRLKEFIGPLVNKGLKSVILFGVPLNCVKVRLGSRSAPSLALMFPPPLRRIQSEHPRTTRKAP